MSRPAIMIVMGVLELVALAYFALIIWHAEALAAVLLRRGYEARGWTAARLTSRLRFIGVAGATVAVVAVGIAVAKAIA